VTTPEVLDLQRRLASRDKTIAKLIERVEGLQARPASSFTLLSQNLTLEQIVRNKTAEVDAQRQALEAALRELQATQARLLQAQKLESVGRLAAGVAHEINTPIQFVADSCTFLQGAVTDLEGLLASYRAVVHRVATGALAPSAAAAELAAADADADAAYLLEEMPKAVARSIDGLERVATIVRSLKEFAHPEGKERAPADLNRAIATTLTIARNEYKFVADVNTEFGDLPPINCHIGELNQAILNVIVNAAHAIASAVAGTDRRGEIRVTTASNGDDAVVITIADTRTGIPPEIVDKIFDPFFTTKSVGQGTGQGLAIVHNVIVDQHGGEVSVESVVGHGTRFRFRLPIAAADAADA